MASDYEVISVVVRGLEGLITEGDKMIQSGQNLSDVKIAIGVSGGAYADFCKLVDRVKETNEKHGFGYDPELVSLSDFEVGNWSELVAKARMLLPIAKQFRNKLYPSSRRIKLNRWSE